MSKIRKNDNDLFSKNLSSTITNLPSGKQSTWIEGAIEKLGLYISDNFRDVDSFFNKYSSETEKLKFEDFYKFVGLNIKCFEGLNLTKDEYLTLFSALDPHKKSYVRVGDLKNKLDIYNFTEKMHKEINTFLTASFKSNIDAFKYFFDCENKDKITNNHLRNSLNTTMDSINKSSLTKKEFFEGINRLFPKKYTTNQILKYIKNKFNNPDKIEFCEFAYVIYEVVQSNNTFMQERI